MIKHSILQSKKAFEKSVAILIIMFFFFDMIVIAEAPTENTVTVEPESDLISSDTFIINITCTPIEPIKAFEVELSFDPMIFTVNNVSEGDFFDPFDTFFNAGVINNSTGMISDVYGLILGPGTVDNSGVLISLNCSILSEGSCPVEITNIGITNDTIYLSVTSVNGTVVVDQSGPEINSKTYSISNPSDTDPSYGWVNVSCSASDDQGISNMTVSVTCPNASILQRSCTEGNLNTWYWNSSTGNSMFTNPGTYSVTFTVYDSSGNANTSSVLTIEIMANWDMNNDHICDLLDYVSISNHYGENNAQAGWIREDVDNNGEIAILDLVILSNNYESSW